ncbi:hypothetical protein MBLNU13_g04262t1 [Cladosporium sp. NU13]
MAPITDYFKSFTIPKNRIPRQDEDDEIIVAPSSSSRATTRERTTSPAKRSTQAPAERKTSQHGTNKVKRGRGRPRKDISTSPSKLRQATPLLQEEESGRSTPTRRSPRKHTAGMNDLQNLPPDSSGLTSVRSSLKSTPTKVRVLEAVEIPSPAKRSSPEMPAPSQLHASKAKNPVNTSFSSFSSLTSFSGTSSQSSSRRIVKNGVQAVTNSDSASMSSSSEDELVDLESFAPRKKRRLSPLPEDSRNDLSDHSKSTRSSTRLSGEQSTKRAKDSWKPLAPPPKTTYKYSLVNMAKQSAKDAASEAKIAKVEAEMQEAERLEKERNQLFSSSVEAKSMMAKEFAQDSEEEERMVIAMERTEVLRGEEKFHFLCGEPGERIELDFPAAELSTCGLSFLQDDSAWQHACTSGFLAAVASQKGLPQQLVGWIHSRIFHEPSEEICEAYVATLGALVRGEHDLPDLHFSFSETHSGQTVRDAAGDATVDGDAPLPPNLKHALATMAVLAPHIGPVNQACTLAELILLNNDENVRSDVAIQLYIERAMHSILESHASVEDRKVLFREITRQILHASSISRHLLSRAIASLPATNLLLHQLRRKLALQILLDGSVDEDIDVTDRSVGVRLLLRLKKHASFHISESTDYTTLHSLIDLLDIAIDVGFSDFAFLSQESQTQQRTAPKSLFGHGTTTSSPAEISFNAQIDDIASHLRLMSSKIRDAGTSHLKRTEAKSALERLIVRLEASVRTKPRPRKGVFDRPGALSAGVLDGYLRRVESENDAAGVSGNGEGMATARTVQSAPGKQHKVTWRDDVVGKGDAGPGADEGESGSESDDEDDETLKDIYGSDT